MIIDIHSHFGTAWNAWWKNEVTEESFIANMDRWGIDKACVSYWGIAHDPDRGNKLVAEFAAKYPDRIIGFACIVPTWWKDAVREVEIAHENPYMLGLKLHPAINHYYSDSTLLNPVVEKAISYDMPMLFHCGADQYSHPRNLGKLAERYKEAKIIMAHMGEEAVVEGVQVAAENENIWLDTTGSYNLYDVMNYAIAYVGEERILFGLDFPAYNCGPEISKVRDADITDRQKELIMGGNAARLLKL